MKKVVGTLFFVVLWVVLGLWCALVGAQKGYTICDVQGCNCTVPAGAWKNVNCNLHVDQELILHPGHIPKEVTEIFISGGQSITFTSKTFHSLIAFTLLRLDGVRRVIVDSKAFFNIQSSSLLVQVLSCNDLLLRTRAFEEMQGSLSTEIIGTKFVKLEQAPFSKLSNCTFQNVAKLTLKSGAFEIRNLGSIGRHGPVTVVYFDNVVIPEIPREVFLTSLAQITFRDSKVGNIESEAFKSAEISAVQMVNTHFETIMAGAFTERTLIVDFKISKCSISRLQSKAIMAAMANLTVNHSTITDIESKAIASTAAKVEMVGNHILNFYPSAIKISNWNRITLDQNIIKNLHADFIQAPTNSDTDIDWFSFKGNEIYNAQALSLRFLQTLDPNKVIFDDNFFNQSCSCELADWVGSLTNSSARTDVVMDTSFCPVDENRSRCFSLPVGNINMQNFTEITCTNNTVCEPYNGETRTINTTGKIFVDYDHNEKRNWLIVVIIIIALLILIIVGTFIVLLIRGSRWLKRKGYFRNQSNEEEENTIVTIDTENEKLEIPDELTLDFLHQLSQRLDDPSTHQEASEMIERLYEMFIVDESYENNNREEEAHLYEELGNLNLQIPPPPYEEQETPLPQQPPPITNTSPRGILRLMEEKFNTNVIPTDDHNTSGDSAKPILSGDYSEPIDGAVHLYSELKQKEEREKKNSVKSNGSNSMALRPLPNKPGYLFEAGPSSTKL